MSSPTGRVRDGAGGGGSMSVGLHSPFCAWPWARDRGMVGEGTLGSGSQPSSHPVPPRGPVPPGIALAKDHPPGGLRWQALK